MNRVYYVRVSDDRQDNDRQIQGLREWAERHGDDLSDWIWQAALKKQPLPDDCPVQWDHGSRDMAETRPSFQKLVKRIERQHRRDKHRIEQFVVYELDRFGCKGVSEWFYYVHVFGKSGCNIISTLKGDLSTDDIKTQIETLFAAMTSREEQKKTAGRVADAKVRIAQAGNADTLGGSTPFGYDRCCVDRLAPDKPIFRIHYLELPSKKLKGQACKRLVIHYDDDGNEIKRQVVQGEGETTKPTTSQKWRLFPSIDPNRVRAVQLIFKWLRDEFPAVSILGICKRLSQLGLMTYNGNGWHYDFVTYIAKQPDYTGHRGYNKRRAARHCEHIPGKGQQNIPEDEKGKYLFRPPEEWVLSPEPTHEAIVDQEIYDAVQAKLATRARRERAHAPINDNGFLKPLLYCATCGRQMTCWTTKKRLKYRCPTYQLRYQNPGNAKYLTECGVNAVDHDAVWAFVQKHTAELKADLSRRDERKERARLVDELWQNRERFDEISGQGLFGYLNRLHTIFNLGEEHFDSKLSNEVLALWDDGKDSDFKVIPADIKQRVARIEDAKLVLARSILDQLQEQHRKLTLAFATLSSDRQRGVISAELRKLEDRMEEIEGELTPILDRLDQMRAEEQDLLDRLDAFDRMVKQSSNRAVGAALAEIYDRIILHFGKRDKSKPKKRHEPDNPWLPEKTQFVPKGDGGDGTAYNPDPSDAPRSSSDRNLDSVQGSPRMW